MEGLAGAASGIAVASLAIQLLQSISTVGTFIRNVKGASKELERLAEMLGRLGALLSDLHDTMQRQTLLQPCPLPSRTIYGCLKSCEASLRLLEDLIDVHNGRQCADASTLIRLKDNIKLGFKSKDITGLEARIQRDITNLNAALGTNAINVQLTTLSVLLRLEQAGLASTSSCSPFPPPLHTTRPTHIPASIVAAQSDAAIVSSAQNWVARSRQWTMSSPLRRFGIHRRRVIRYVDAAGRQTGLSYDTANKIISETYETSWTVLGYGFHWSRQQYPYGSIVPSLRVFPIVEDITRHEDLISKGTVQEVQQAFTSGVLHPFITSTTGCTLLHLAAAAQRPDLCLLFSEYGLRPGFTIRRTSPLFSCLTWEKVNSSQVPNFSERVIDTLRVVLLHFDQIDDPNSTPKRVNSPHVAIGFLETRLDIVEWLWTHAALAFDDAELLHLRAKIARALVDAYVPHADSHNDSITQLLIKLMNDEMKYEYTRGTFKLMICFGWRDCSIDSAFLGTNILNLLSGLGLDAETCITKELEGGLFLDPSLHSPGRKIIFEDSEAQGRKLRWEWVFDSHAPGYHVVYEFRALAADSYVSDESSQWPFFEIDNCWSDHRYQEIKRKKATRFERCIATKARKERARKGQKRHRSSIPGAWDW